MERRDFLKKSIFLGAGLTIGASLDSQGSSRPKNVSILHTNDIHSRIEPFPNDGSKWANQGGLTKLSTVIQQIRNKDENILLLDAGDVFQGTPYFNFYGGALEFKLMSKMGFDASTLGNHEFDNGLSGIYEQLPHAIFPHLIANYDFTDTLLNNAFAPYKIFKRNGLKVGVFGLGIALKGLVADKNFGNTKYMDPIAVSKEMVQELNKKQCDLIICLSHLGYSYKSEKIDDLKLAAKVDGIDLIIGGHTHTLLEEPTALINAQGHTTLINQVGTGATRLGKVDFEFSSEKKIKHAHAQNLPIY